MYATWGESITQIKDHFSKTEGSKELFVQLINLFGVIILRKIIDANNRTITHMASLYSFSGIFINILVSCFKKPNIENSKLISKRRLM